MANLQVPDNISEEYYQISEAILSSFPKYRPPLDLFTFNSDIGQLVSYSRKGARLSNEEVEKAHALCAEGDLFVSRRDHPVYSEHIVKQLDLVLVDQNLKEAEVADICLKALESRLEDFFDQPVKPVFDLLHTDCMVVLEYLWADVHRLRLFFRRLHRKEHTLARQSINCFIVGLWLFSAQKNADLRRRDFDQAGEALLLKDAGMAKVPAFITSKTTPLKPEEREKILAHPLAGYKLMHKLEQTFDLMRQACLEHHERLDGSGYPQHAREISSFGRLAALADSFAAMVQQRPYAAAKEPSEAARELSMDRTRYDSASSGSLLAALLSDSFGKMK
ncbi:MAG: HD family phosphohydrolase [Deltaproteobacteria bacterium]|jgi:response regulator RpfG family c-di-GMP phosphodiesterase|nr:HD family phosphohydrolase [Deltaproteobacteria bacterium]